MGGRDKWVNGLGNGDAGQWKGACASGDGSARSGDLSPRLDYDNRSLGGGLACDMVPAPLPTSKVASQPPGTREHILFAATIISAEAARHFSVVFFSPSLGARRTHYPHSAQYGGADSQHPAAPRLPCRHRPRSALVVQARRRQHTHLRRKQETQPSPDRPAGPDVPAVG